MEMIGFDSLVGIADKVGIIQLVKGKLLRQPDIATDKLVTVIEEIYKIYSSIEAELSNYLSLWFDPSMSPANNRAAAVLIALEGGEIRARMGKARGHCGKITNIYHRYLNPWFDNVLNSKESTKMKELFDELHECDTIMLDHIDFLADWLSNKATTTLYFVDNGEFEEANRQIQMARKEALPGRRAVAKAMRDLLDLQADFIEISGTD